MLFFCIFYEKSKFYRLFNLFPTRDGYAAVEFRHLLVCTGGQKKEEYFQLYDSPNSFWPNCLAILAKIDCFSCETVTKMG